MPPQLTRSAWQGNYGLAIGDGRNLSPLPLRISSERRFPNRLTPWYGFKHLKLNRIYAHHRVRNPASGRVLAKLGFKQEGLMRQCVRKSQGFEDMVLMALLRGDWEQLSRQ